MKNVVHLILVCTLVLVGSLFHTPVEAQGNCTAAAGTLNGYKPSDCLTDDGAVIGAIPSGDAVVPPGYQVLFVLTSGSDLVIEQVSAFPVFTVTGVDLYTIHTLVYDPATLDLSIVQFGVTTGVDVASLLIQGGGSICASLDVEGTTISVDNPSAGALLPVAAAVCLDSGSATIAAALDISPYAPNGYSVLYVLTEGAGLVIQAVSATPQFTVSAAGNYTIHTLVYDAATLDLSIVQFGATTGFDVNGLLIQGGGGICAALDVAGAPIAVSDCGNVCTADAGTLVGYKPSDCLNNGSALIGAIPQGDAVVPPGYQVLYVLTSGPDLAIEQVSGTPVFTVTSLNFYTIHTLVYDPATLDLSGVVFGTTTGFDVNALLIQGGGSICAALDVEGAVIVVDNPDAGSLEATATDLCWEPGGVDIGAAVVSPPNVPLGYSVLYVLTEGSGLVIQAVSPTPQFTVNAVGEFTIHTLVYDPATLDLSGVVFGTTTGFDVNALLVQGGGSICAALDVAGAQIKVSFCDGPCAADAGTLTGVLEVPCLGSPADSVLLEAAPNNDAFVPVGFSTVYVLTQGTGLTIVNAGAVPAFTVSDTGRYTIHTLVYDPTTLDLAIVQLGVTTGFDVNGLLVQGGGEICASLDVAGAVFTVSDCPQQGCTADAGTLAPGTQVCLFADVPGGPLSDGMLITSPNGDAVVPPGFSTLYVLTSGSGLVIEQVNTFPEFFVNTTGDRTIHTLVYDPATLDLSAVGQTVFTGFDVNALLIQGGGTICGSLDVAGAAFTTVDCTPNCTVFAGTLNGPTEVPCLAAGDSVLLEAFPNGDAVVPSANYSTLYVLTSGSGLTIVNAGASPAFWVSAPGAYTIHTLIYDPNTLDLSIVELGVTTGFDVNALLLQGGGAICASLDVNGAPFVVSDCVFGAYTVSVWPTIADDQLTVIVNASVEERVGIAVTGANGQRSVLAADVRVVPGINRLPLDVQSVAQGQYLLTVQGAAERATARFVKD